MGVNRKNGEGVKLHAFAPLCEDIVAIGKGTNIEIWNVQPQPNLILRLENGHSKPILSLVVLNNGDLASASEENFVKIWSRCTDAYDITRFNNNRTSVLNSNYGLKILANFGNGLVIADDGKIQIWNRNEAQDIYEQGVPLAINRLEGFRKTIDDIKSLAEFQEELVILYKTSNIDFNTKRWSPNNLNPVDWNLNINSLAKLDPNSLIYKIGENIHKLDGNQKYTYVENPPRLQSLPNRQIEWLKDLRNGCFLGYSGDFSHIEIYENGERRWSPCQA